MQITISYEKNKEKKMDLHLIIDRAIPRLKEFKPSAANVSVIPSTSGTSGPTTTIAISFTRHHCANELKSLILGGLGGEHIFSDPA